ncbi:phospholipase domain-containing protein [Streptomyces sp. NPDC087849]|uniref:phospholipase domain-containing protein n=1 Tax=Streptomyces sp. NPDC087849 TaxID=3365808 RepID=UPI0037F865C9
MNPRVHTPGAPHSYAPFVGGAADLTTGKYKLTFSAGDQAGAAVQVRSQKRTDGPWTYTAAAGKGKSASDSWNSGYSGGSYDLTAHGPNGFLRTFKGNNKAAEPEVTARHDAGNLKLTLTNPSTADAHLTVTNAYGGGRQT